MVDSESSVKVDTDLNSIHDSESLMSIRDKLSRMRGNRDTVVSDFTRFKIREWVENGGDQKDIAIKGGMRSASTVAMVKRGQGVGGASTAGFAKAFGYESVEAYVDAAYAWRKGLGFDLERRLADPNFKTAASALGAFMEPPTEAEIRAIASGFVAPRFDGREVDYWVQTLGAELKRDRMQKVTTRVQKQEEAKARQRRVRTEEQAWREAGDLKQKLAAEPAEEPVKSKRRRAL